MVTTRVEPRFTARFFNASTTVNAVMLSKPLVGSSRNITEGSWMMSTAMLTRRFSPPERPRFMSLPTMVSATWSMPSSRMVSCTMACFSAHVLSGMRNRAAYKSVSFTVSKGNNASDCIT
jgi:hypothetical protein